MQPKTELDEWTYWVRVAQEALVKPQKQGDWLAWLRFRAKVIGPFD